MLEVMCPECGQGFWSVEPKTCPRCSYQTELAKVNTGWSEDPERLWVEKTLITATAAAVRQFIINAIAEIEGHDAELLREDPANLLWVSEEIVWWKPAVAPFSDPEYQQSILANPEDPGALPFWEVDVTAAWTIGPIQALAD